MGFNSAFKGLKVKETSLVFKSLTVLVAVEDKTGLSTSGRYTGKFDGINDLGARESFWNTGNEQKMKQ